VKASFTTKGAHSLKATYAPLPNDTAWKTSSGALSETVQALGVKTTTSVALAPSPAPLGGRTVLTATVKGCQPDPISMPAAGSVDFVNTTTGADLGTVVIPPDEGNCPADGEHASIEAVLDKPGANNIKATFTSFNENEWLSSVGSHAVTVKYLGAKTTTKVSATANPAPLGATTTLLAVVDGCVGGLEPEGTVDFVDATTHQDLGSAALPEHLSCANGARAFINVTFAKSGSHTIKAIYSSADQNVWLNSTGSVSLPVKYLGVKTTTTVSADPAAVDQQTQVRATITGCEGGSATGISPRGTVEIVDATTHTVLGTTSIASAPCAGPTVVPFEVTFATPGTHALKATYASQDQNLWLSSSGSKSITVAR
jgi:hypothetical protein